MDEENNKNLFGEPEAKPLFGQTEDFVPAAKPLFETSAAEQNAAPEASPLFEPAAAEREPENEETSLSDFQKFDAVPEAFPDAALQPEAPAEVIPSPAAELPEEPVQEESPVQEAAPAPEVIPEEPPAAPAVEIPAAPVPPAKPRGIVRPPAVTISLGGDLESMSLGAIMALAREKAGFSMEDVHNATKLHVRFLQAIEHDHFESLPVGSFPGAYVRSLCALYHLEPSATEIAMKKAASYCTKSHAPDGVYTHLQDHAQINVAEQEKVRKWFISAVAVFIGLIVLIVALTVMSVMKKNKPDPVPVSSPVTMESLERLSGPQMPTMRKLDVPGSKK